MGAAVFGQDRMPDWKPIGPAAALALIALVALARPGMAADIALGEYLAGECAGCHQLSGQQSGGIPRIAGLTESAFIAALKAYRTGERHNPVMRGIAGRLTEEDIAALAAFFATQKPN